jgi:predicted Zn-dependent protease
MRPALPAEHAPLRVAATPQVAAPPVVPTPAINVLRASVTQPPAPEPAEDDPLALVARCLERGDHAGAATHLEDYVRRHPDQPMFRAQLAELYLRADRPADAKFHFEQFVADAQAGPAALRAYLVHCHTRLMEIGRLAGDRFAELFHRGVGLLLLVKEQDGVKDRDEQFCEEMLCKAIRALSEAKGLKPGDPRVRAYLAEAHDRAGNRRAANAERVAARSGVVAGELTAAERRALPLRE